MRTPRTSSCGKPGNQRLSCCIEGAENRWPKFAERLSRTVEQLKQTAFTEEAEYADGLLLVHRCFERQMPVHEVVENLTQHAREFPGGDTCAKLFLAYTKKLAERGQKNYAKQCCQAAIWALHDHPDVDSIRHQVSVLDAKANIARNWAAFSASAQLKPDDAIQRELNQQVAQVRSMLPIRVDSATTLTDVSAGSHSIDYRYTVTISASADDSAAGQYSAESDPTRTQRERDAADSGEGRHSELQLSRSKRQSAAVLLGDKMSSRQPVPGEKSLLETQPQAAEPDISELVAAIRHRRRV